MKRMTILLIEETELLASVYMEYLRHENADVVHVTTGNEAFVYLTEDTPDIILLDMNLSDSDGMEILRYISSIGIDSSVIVITAYGSVSSVVDAMRLGAFEYLQKPFDKSRLLFTVRNAMERTHLRQVVDTYASQYGRAEFHGMLGNSKAMQSVYQTIENVASSSATVFITGESGTGKELCAQAIHVLSSRMDKELVTLNCSAIPQNLMESEIFGHVKGAFTGALSDREGAAQRAHEGTLFLDEICELNIDLQAKLLRVIQSGTFQRVGTAKTSKVDIRYICATNRDPLEMVKKGLFREDLYYRLNVIPIRLPSLRDRGRDKIEIAQKLLKIYSKEEGKNFSSYSRDVADLILEHPWPGNVRQLQNVIRNVVVLNEGEVVRVDMLPKDFLDYFSRSSLKKTAEISVNGGDEGKVHGIRSYRDIRPLWVREKEAIEEAIELCNGNIVLAASYLEINPSTIYRKIKLWQDNEISESPAMVENDEHCE